MVPAVAVLALLTAMSACSSSSDGSGDESGFVPGDPGSTYVEVTDRSAAPDLSGDLLGGGTYSMADDRGDDVLVVNVWGSWCAPCRAEAAALEEVYQELQDQGVQFLGINTRDQEKRALAFLADEGVTYPSLVDDGALQAGFRTSLPVAGIPTTFVIDRSGRVAARAVTEVTYTRLLELVERVLAEDETASDQ